MKRTIILLSGYLLVFASCSNSNSEQKESTPVAMSQMDMRNLHISKVDSLESIVYGDSIDLRSSRVSELIELYISYPSKYGGDQEKSPEFLYKAAALYRATGVPVEAIKRYTELLKRYPNYIRNSEAAFLLAFTYDEDLNQKDLAKEAYNEVIANYPDDIWAHQSEERLKTIDMSDEELIERFMKQNHSGTSSE